MNESEVAKPASPKTEVHSNSDSNKTPKVTHNQQDIKNAQIHRNLVSADISQLETTRHLASTGNCTHTHLTCLTHCYISTYIYVSSMEQQQLSVQNYFHVNISTAMKPQPGVHADLFLLQSGQTMFSSTLSPKSRTTGE
jgi:hypothetical protein